MDHGEITPRSAEEILRLELAAKQAGGGSAWHNLRPARMTEPSSDPGPLERIAATLERIAAALERDPGPPVPRPGSDHPKRFPTEAERNYWNDTVRPELFRQVDRLCLQLTWPPGKSEKRRAEQLFRVFLVREIAGGWDSLPPIEDCLERLARIELADAARRAAAGPSPYRGRSSRRPMTGKVPEYLLKLATANKGK